MRFRRVIPNAYCSVTRASRNKLFTHADVKASDFSTMKRSEDIVKLRFVIIRIDIVVIQVDFGGDELTMVRDRVNFIVVLIGRDSEDSGLLRSMLVRLTWLSHLDRQAVSVFAQKGPLITIL